MSATIIDGKAIAAEVRRQVAQDVADLTAALGFPPGLAVIRVGEDPASKVYVSNKRKAAAQVGVRSWEYALPEETPREELLDLIDRLNRDREVHGILVQLPLPSHLDETEIINAVAPEKDVDGFHPLNVGRLWSGAPGLVPCTPAGIMELIRRTGVDPKGRRAVVIGRSNIVGKPVAALLLAAHATVTICHPAPRISRPSAGGGHPGGRRRAPAPGAGRLDKAGRGRHRRRHQPASRWEPDG